MGMPSQQPATEALEASQAYQARASHSDPRVTLDDSRILFDAACRDEMLDTTDIHSSMHSLFKATLAAQDFSFPSITWSDDESEHSDIDLTLVSYDSLVLTTASTGTGLITTDDCKGREGRRKRKRVVPSCAGRRMVRSREISSKLWMLASPSAVFRPFTHKNFIAKLA